MKPCVVDVAIGGNYPAGQDRLVGSLAKVGYLGARLMYRDALPPGSPAHAENPYAFKWYALREAERAGNDLLIWVDASVWFTHDLTPLMTRVEKDGYYFQPAGFNVGQWCTDDALPKLGVGREEAFGISMVAATYFGLSTKWTGYQQLMSWMFDRISNGAFRGPWTNADHKASNDPRVLGHRHDQTALSVIIKKMGLEMNYASPLFVYDTPTPVSTAIAHARGM